jgi:hypothetical protein
MGALASVTVPEHPEHPPTIWPWFSSFGVTLKQFKDGSGVVSATVATT